MHTQTERHLYVHRTAPLRALRHTKRQTGTSMRTQAYTKTERHLYAHSGIHRQKGTSMRTRTYAQTERHLYAHSDIHTSKHQTTPNHIEALL